MYSLGAHATRVGWSQRSMSPSFSKSTMNDATSSWGHIIICDPEYRNRHRLECYAPTGDTKSLSNRIERFNSAGKKRHLYVLARFLHLDFSAHLSKGCPPPRFWFGKVTDVTLSCLDASWVTSAGVLFVGVPGTPEGWHLRWRPPIACMDCDRIHLYAVWATNLLDLSHESQEILCQSTHPHSEARGFPFITSSDSP